MSKKAKILYDEYSELMEELYSQVEKEKPLEEKFSSKAQQKYFYWKASQKGKEGKKWKKMADEFSGAMKKKDWENLPEKVEENTNPKMSKKHLVEYVNNFKSEKLTKKDVINIIKNEI